MRMDPALAAQRERDPPLDGAEPGRAALTGRRRGGQPLGKDPARAGDRGAPKAADPQMQFNGAALPRQIRHSAAVGTVPSGGGLITQGTDRRGVR